MLCTLLVQHTAWPLSASKGPPPHYRPLSWQPLRLLSIHALLPRHQTIATSTLHPRKILPSDTTIRVLLRKYPTHLLPNLPIQAAPGNTHRAPLLSNQLLYCGKASIDRYQALDIYRFPPGVALVQGPTRVSDVAKVTEECFWQLIGEKRWGCGTGSKGRNGRCRNRG